jgi:pyruvate-formate lyase
MAEVYRTLPIHIEEGERLLGWQGAKMRCNNFSIESHAHWLESDFETFETRAFDPWQISAEDKEELRTEHIPYWTDKTLTSKFKAQTRLPRILLESGYVDCSNYISNPGSHFVPDYHELFAIGFRGHYEKAKKIMEGLDWKEPENVGKKDFYEGIMEVCCGIREYGQKLKAFAYEAAEKESDPVRKEELITSGDRAEKIRTYNYPQNRVTDHRIGFTITQLDRVMEGRLQDVIDALQADDEKKKLESAE